MSDEVEVLFWSFESGGFGAEVGAELSDSTVAIGSKRLSEGLLTIRLVGAGNEARTRDLDLGKVALYQLSYTR